MADEVMEQEATDLGEVEVPEVDDAPDTDMPAEEGDESDDQEESEDGDESEEDDAPAEEEEKPVEVAVTDGRKMPDAVKKLLALGKTSNPEGTKIMRATWFQNQDYRAVFPTPSDAVALKNAYEEIGGADGVAQIQAERQEWADVDKAIGEGRAAELLKDNPELLGKNAVGVVNEWAKAAPEQYGYYQNIVTANKIESLGLQSGLVELHNYLKDADPQAAAYVAKMHDKIVDVREAAKQYEQKRVDPAREALEKDKQTFAEQRRADFEGAVATEAESYRDKAIDKAIEGLLNGRKADDDQMKHYRKLVREEVGERLGKIPGFDSQLEAQYRTGNRQESVAWLQKQFDRIIGVGKAASVIDPLLRNINPQKAVAAKTNGTKPASKTSSDAGSVTLNDWPDHDKIDWTKTTSADVAQGHAILTNGKKASGWL